MKLYDENTGLWRFLKTDKGASKSLEIIKKILYRLGLSKNEMEIYIYVARRGEHKASQISEALSLYRTERALSQIEVPKLQTALGYDVNFFLLLNLMFKTEIKVVGIDSVAITYACEPPQKYAVCDPYPCDLPPYFLARAKKKNAQDSNSIRIVHFN